MPALTGRARLKTGTLRNATALAGYLPDQDGNVLVVAAMLNHDNAKSKISRPNSRCADAGAGQRIWQASQTGLAGRRRGATVSPGLTPVAQLVKSTQAYSPHAHAVATVEIPPLVADAVKAAVRHCCAERGAIGDLLLIELWRWQKPLLERRV